MIQECLSWVGDRKKCRQRPRDRDWPRGLNFPSILDVLHWMDFELAIYYETTYHRWRKPWLGVWGRNSQIAGALIKYKYKHKLIFKKTQGDLKIIVYNFVVVKCFDRCTWWSGLTNIFRLNKSNYNHDVVENYASQMQHVTRAKCRNMFAKGKI